MKEMRLNKIQAVAHLWVLSNPTTQKNKSQTENYEERLLNTKGKRDSIVGDETASILSLVSALYKTEWWQDEVGKL